MLTYDKLDDDQLDAIDRIYEDQDVYLAADVGSGKTVICLTALQYLIEDGLIEAALIIAPPRVAESTWVQEISEWEHLKLGGVTTSGMSPKQREAALSDTAYDFVVLSYENFLWLSRTYPRGKGLERFQMLICDEVDKMKDTGTARFKGQPARKDKNTGKVIEKPVMGLKGYRQFFDRHVTMTGTPTSKGLQDLWAQMYICDGGRCLGTRSTAFKARYFYSVDDYGRQLEPFPDTAEQIYERIAPVCHRIEMRSGDGVPHIREMPPRLVDMNEVQLNLYRELQKEAVLYLETKHGGVEVLSGDISSEEDYRRLIVTADHVVGIDSPAVLWGKLRQVAAGFLYLTDEDDETERKTEWLCERKMNELDDLISELQGQQLLIVHAYEAQASMLRARYPGRLKILDGQSTIDEWNAGDLELMSIHPFSAGHGLNLQKSHAHHIAVLTEPRTGGLYRQVLGRLARRGNRSEYVNVHHIHTRWTNDSDDLAICFGRIETDRDLLNAMKTRMKKWKQ